jgi:hypothetical protein
MFVDSGTAKHLWRLSYKTNMGGAFSSEYRLPKNNTAYYA